MPPEYEIVYVVMLGQNVDDEWVKSPLFRDAHRDREAAEQQREDVLRFGSWTAIEVTIESFRIVS